jgi:hypothetical protein
MEIDILTRRHTHTRGERRERERQTRVTRLSGLTNSYSTDKKSVSFTIPKNVPSGKYLVRVESIALHQAQNVGGAQIYLSCAQVEVTGGGNGTPGPLVAFPGAYKATDPGLRWSYYPIATSYTAPGPAVWTG